MLEMLGRIYEPDRKLKLTINKGEDTYYKIRK